MDVAQLKSAIVEAESDRDASVSGNAALVAPLNPKTAYSKNITLEEWNQLIEDMSAALENAMADRDLATAVANAVSNLLDNYVEWSFSVSPSGYLSGELTETVDDTGTHRAYSITFNPANIAGLMDGTIAAGRAVSDELGRDITETYATVDYPNTFTELNRFKHDVAMEASAIEFSQRQASVDFSYGIPALRAKVVLLTSHAASSEYALPFANGSSYTLATTWHVSQITNGDVAAYKAVRDGLGNVISATYETKADAASKVTRASLVATIGEATQSLNGLMSATDKARLDSLYALLGATADADTFVNTINEILAVFSNYPEEVDLVSALAAKLNVSDVIDGLSSNEAAKPLSARQGKVLNERLSEVEANYVDHDDVFAAGMIAVSGYNQHTGEITLEYNTSVMSVSYGEHTGIMTFTY